MIEAVHSSNPISQLRHMKLRELTQECSAGRVYISAFENIQKFAQFSKEISWETEVWIADNPEHMIHFDGERFLGPYS
jgi:type II restriction enzyme